jgi:hypothetical protein
MYYGPVPVHTSRVISADLMPDDGPDHRRSRVTGRKHSCVTLRQNNAQPIIIIESGNSIVQTTWAIIEVYLKKVEEKETMKLLDVEIGSCRRLPSEDLTLPCMPQHWLQK